MRVIVTRPAAQAVTWVATLQDAGLDAVALPLIGIAPPDDPTPVIAAWSRLADYRLVMFVSPNAAEQFFALREPGAAWPAGVLAASPGPGTTGTLRQLGVPEDALVEPAADAPQFDSEALWAVLRGYTWDESRVLIVRGTSGRDWLAGRFAAHGALVDFVAAYRRAAPAPDPDGGRVLDAAVADPGAHLWFFSSSEAIDHLAALRPDTAWSPAAALATHPRIAERARALGFGRVLEARPAASAVVACIQSLA